MKKSHVFNCESSKLYSIILNESLKQNGFNIEDAKVGFKFEKELKNQLGQSSKITQQIVELEKDKKIVIEVTNIHDTYKISYNLTEKNGMTELVYEENYKSNKNLRYFNNLIMSFIYKKRINKKINNIFGGLEKMVDDVS